MNNKNLWTVVLIIALVLLLLTFMWNAEQALETALYIGLGITAVISAMMLFRKDKSVTHNVSHSGTHA